MKIYDMACLGPISIDFNIEPDGMMAREIGGAISYSPFAAAACGAKLVVLAKGNPKEVSFAERFQGLKGEVVILPSELTTSIENKYLDASHEVRISKMKAQAECFTLAEVKDYQAKIYHLGGLIYGDFRRDFIKELSQQGDIALDAQCLLRHGNPETGEMTYVDWAAKEEVLPLIKYFKVDAKEAEILTAEKDRFKAAKKLAGWGAKEIFISFHNQMLVYDGKSFYTCDYQAKSTVGRTGRGDTVFCAYLAYRQNHPIAEALQIATAIVSLKMTKTGPYMGGLAAAKAYAQQENLQVKIS